jgi:hypothetical protein
VALARLELAFYLPDPMPLVTHRNNREQSGTQY